MKQAKKRKKRSKKTKKVPYLLFDSQDQYSLVDEKVLASFPRELALGIVARNWMELNRLLTEDAVEGEDIIIGDDIPVTTGILNSLIKLNDFHPAVLDQVRSLSKINRC